MIQVFVERESQNHSRANKDERINRWKLIPTRKRLIRSKSPSKATALLPFDLLESREKEPLISNWYFQFVKQRRRRFQGVASDKLMQSLV